MVTVLSPHLDDAVLSCWHLLGGEGEVRVVNVFAGGPQPGVTLSWWDRLRGARDSATRIRERMQEDRAALAVGGRAAVMLDLPEQLYRRNGVRPDVASRLRDVIEDGSVVYAPAGLGIEHVDHLLTRDAALSLHGEAFEVRLYADLPHAHVFGPPSEGFDPTPWWDATLRGAGVAPERLERTIHRLDDEAFARKLEAARHYRSQLPLLERYAPLADLRVEVTWRFAA